MAPYIGYDSDTTFIPGTLNTSSSLFIQGGGITQTGGDVSFDSGTLFIDEDLNRVGIGTTSPLSKLSIGSTSTDRISIDWIGGGGPYSVAAIEANMQSGEVKIGAVNTGGTHFVTLYSNNSEAARITSTGNVGIGTTNPSQKLHVYGAGDVSAIFKSTNAGSEISLDATNGYASLRIFDSGTEKWRIGQIGQSNDFQIWQIGTGERVRVTSSGNVGIGITNPTQKLEVTGNVNINGNLYLNGSNNSIIADQSTATYLKFTVGSVDGVYIQRISTSACQLRVRQYSTGSTAATYPILTNVNDTNTGIFFPSDTDTLGISTGGLERLRIDSTGNVGINRTNPSYPLDVQHVNGDLDQTPIIRVFQSSNGCHNAITLESSTSVDKNIGIQFKNSSSVKGGIGYIQSNKINIYTGTNATAAQGVLIDGNGNVGIGTTNPNNKLHVTQNIRISDTSNPYLVLYDGTNTGYLQIASTVLDLYHNGNISFSPGQSVKALLDSTGRFMVGQQSPYGASGGGNSIGSFTLSGDFRTNFAISNQTNGADAGAALVLASYGQDWVIEGGSILKNSKALTIKSSTTEVIRVDSSGNVGIGTTNPGYLLDVTGVVNSIGYRAQGNYNSTQQLPDLGLYSGSSSHPDGFGTLLLSSRRSAQRPIIFATSDGTDLQERVRISSSGNVGIGITNPSQKLNVVGNIMLDGSDQYCYLSNVGTFNSGIYVRGRSSTSELRSHSTGIFTWEVTGSEKLRIDSSGNVGIGTTNPSTKLHTYTTSGTNLVRTETAANSTIGLEIVKTGLTTQSWRIVDGQTTNGKLEFYDVTDSATRMVIDGSGNIGIGTINPSQKLHVIGAALITLDIQLTGSNPRIDFNSNGSSALRFWDTANNIERARIDTSGRLGVGTTSPYYFLDVRFDNATTSLSGGSGGDWDGQGIRIQNNNQTVGAMALAHFRAYDGDWHIGSKYYANGGNTDFIFLHEGVNERLRIKGSSGNVGIGTTDPQYKLEVNGSFAATTKSFIIPHPTKEGYKLRHGSLEGPENGVYVRGRSTETIISLPDYWVGLVDADSITVNLTPIGPSGAPRVERIENNKVYVFSEDSRPLDYFYMVNAERVDVAPLEVEIPPTH
jgi:hypothetical protein